MLCPQLFQRVRPDVGGGGVSLYPLSACQSPDGTNKSYYTYSAPTGCLPGKSHHSCTDSGNPGLLGHKLLFPRNRPEVGLHPFRVSVTLEKANVGYNPIQDLCLGFLRPRPPQPHVCTNSCNFPMDISEKTKLFQHPLPKHIPHHASEGWVKGARALQTLRRACEKALYWGVQQGGAMPSPPTCPHPFLGPWGEGGLPTTGPPLSLVQ